MHSVHGTYRTSELSLACPKRAQHTGVSLQSGRIILLLPPHHTRQYPTTSHKPRKRSKFEVQSLLNTHCFCSAVKSENRKPTRCKLGTVCVDRSPGSI